MVGVVIACAGRGVEGRLFGSGYHGFELADVVSIDRGRPFGRLCGGWTCWGQRGKLPPGVVVVVVVVVVGVLFGK